MATLFIQFISNAIMDNHCVNWTIKRVQMRLVSEETCQSSMAVIFFLVTNDMGDNEDKTVFCHACVSLYVRYMHSRHSLIDE